jgi:methionyl-tRNA formyltransferase
MRIEFLTQDDPLYVLPFFDEFIRHYAGEFEILQIASSPTMGKRSRKQLLKELRELYGVRGLTKLLAQLAASRVFGLFLKKPDARRFYSIGQLCSAYGISHVPIGNPNAPEFVESIKRRAPDVLVSVACPYILKEPLLQVASRGAINIHHAPLPRYKGMMPTFWQLFHGEKSVGVTIHHMVAKLDEGDALYQGELAVEPGESLDNLIKRAKRHGAHCMAQVLRQIRDNKVNRVRLDHTAGSYFTFPTSAEIREFRRRGLRAI